MASRRQIRKRNHVRQDSGLGKYQKDEFVQALWGDTYYNAVILREIEPVDTGAVRYFIQYSDGFERIVPIQDLRKCTDEVRCCLMLRHLI